MANNFNSKEKQIGKILKANGQTSQSFEFLQSGLDQGAKQHPSSELFKMKQPQKPPRPFNQQLLGCREQFTSSHTQLDKIGCLKRQIGVTWLVLKLN